MTFLNIYTKDSYFSDNMKKLVNKAIKTEKVDDNISITLITNDKTKFLDQAEKGAKNFGYTALYIIDVEGKQKADGVELAREVRKKNPYAYIFFIGDGRCDARDLMSHSIKASDYLCKPLGTYEFVDMINESVYDYSQMTKIKKAYYSGNIVVNSGYKKAVIALSDILMVEFNKPKSVIVTTYGRITVSIPMSELLIAMNEVDTMGTIIRTHQSYIVNLVNVESADIAKLELTMKKGIKVPIARTRKLLVQEALEKTVLMTSEKT
ncbi:MAG: LytTR family transcriptional regulator DNA-binding domain-containing protein [Clostridia bacterium]|nr:LytTR family transcriptional regulator DNA-binding domain-containing protein [Clostridia bacterium]